MATENAGIHEDHFVSELNRVKKEVQEKFVDLRNRIQERERILIEELDCIISRYTSFKENFKNRMAERDEVENLIDRNKNELLISEKTKKILDSFITQLNERLNQIQILVKPDLVTLVCEPDNLLTELSRFCTLVKAIGSIDYSRKTIGSIDYSRKAIGSIDYSRKTIGSIDYSRKAIGSIDYSRKTKPLISACCKGRHNDELDDPQSVAVDPDTGNIYVTDKKNNCIKVFNTHAKYLTKFGLDDGEGKLKYPRCLAISGNRVFITQGNFSIFVYQLDGKFIRKIGSSGEGDLQFNFPWGLTADNDNGDLYICDLSNNRIQILSENFQYKSQFGKDDLNKPRHVRLTKGDVFVLDDSSPCLHIFGREDFVIKQNVITKGEGLQVSDPHYFFVDRFGYVLVSDHESNSIFIFNSEFRCLHRIAVNNSPMEVTMDTEDRIIVVCQAGDNCIQIF